MDPTGLTILFPCYNDARTIGMLVAQADRVAGEFTNDYELIVVDDGSRDDSRSLLKKLASRYSRLRLVFHNKNEGYGAALLSGFRHATKDWVFYTDSDGQYDVLELGDLLRMVRANVDMVNGYRIVRNDPLYRIAIGSFYRWCMRLLFNFQVRDLSCDFRLIRRRVFEAIDLRCTSGAICIELVKKLGLAGFHSIDCPVHHFRRPHGRSQFFSPRHLWATAFDILRLWWELKWKSMNTPR